MSGAGEPLIHLENHDAPFSRRCRSVHRFIVVIAVVAPISALVTALGVATASASATSIQVWFRVQAKRSHFRRRQTSSRIETFAEAGEAMSEVCRAFGISCKTGYKIFERYKEHGRGPDRPFAPAGSLRQPVAAADREPDRRSQA